MLSASLPTWPGRIQCCLRKAAFRAVDRGKFLPNLEEGTSEAVEGHGELLNLHHPDRRQPIFPCLSLSLCVCVCARACVCVCVVCVCVEAPILR